MYARRAGGKTLTFQVSGLLWKRSLVMRDRETGSLWSHLLGEAMQGPLKGAVLEPIPSAMTDWETWRQKHPDTTVVLLKRTSKDFVREVYKHPSRFVIGIAEGGSARAWPFDELMKQPVVNDEFQKTPLVVVFEKASGTALLYERSVDEGVLTFALEDGRLIDTGTNTRWDWATGRALAGPLKGKQLKALPGVVSFRRSWHAFHPQSAYWTAGR